jgi:8-hydroxy-5-deazaflavin:NADPH oxidoreductase
MAAKVTIIGAGKVGGNLGARLSQSGVAVRFGVKPGTESSSEMQTLLARCKDASVADSATAAKWADVVFLSLPGDVALEVARSLANDLAGKVVVDCNNPLAWKDGPVWAPTPEGSLAASIAKAVPGARVVKGFNQFGAEFHGDPMHAGPPGAQVFLASDDAGAKKLVSEIATQAGFQPVDAGPLRNAPVLENLAILWIHLAMVGGQGRDFAFAMQRKGAR